MMWFEEGSRRILVNRLLKQQHLIWSINFQHETARLEHISSNRGFEYWHASNLFTTLIKTETKLPQKQLEIPSKNY